MNNTRLPKKQYFQLRLQQAIDSANTQKAEYYLSRLLQIAQRENAAAVEHGAILIPVQE